MSVKQLGMTALGAADRKVAVPRPQNKEPTQREIVAKILLFGSGLQSSYIAELILAGELERPDLVVFNDTNAEPYWVHNNAHNLCQRLRQAGVTFLKAQLNCGGIRWGFHFKDVHGTIPAYVKNANGSRGMLRRQCTDYYKIEPGNLVVKLWLASRGYIKLHPDLDLRPDKYGWPHIYERGSLYHVWWDDIRGTELMPRFPNDIAVEMWFGYTTDERIRLDRMDAPGWMKPRAPLIEMGKSREDCGEWYDRQGLRRPLKSACTCCSYRRDPHWLWMKRHAPGVFEDACWFDRALRDPATKQNTPYGVIEGEMYLHESCRPLAEVDFEANIRRQPSLFELELVESCKSDGGFT